MFGDKSASYPQVKIALAQPALLPLTDPFPFNRDEQKINNLARKKKNSQRKEYSQHKSHQEDVAKRVCQSLQDVAARV